MEASNQIFGIMMLALSLGLIHAFDADHILAISTLSGRRAGIKNSISFCCRWALGHGFTLLLISLLVLVLDWGVPSSLSHLAEHLVGVVLVLLGLWVVWDIAQQRRQLHIQQHAKHEAQKSHHTHKYSATLIGILHGAAGSAPLLAILPISKLASAWTGMAYVLIFGMGVFIAMLVFGGMLGRLFVLAAARGKQGINSLRVLLAVGSIFYGVWLLSGAIK